MKLLLSFLLIISTGLALSQDASKDAREAEEAATRLIKKKREKIRTTTTETVKKPQKEKTDE